MCNAWNHSPSCTCGWGGDGHLGRRTLFSSLIQSNVVFKTYRDLWLGFTNPNAKCPVCGASVYFYASPNGGRVFFDELGPPWPKHPCTDYGKPVIRLTPPVILREELNKTHLKDGWIPYLCQDIQTIRGGKSIFQLTGLVNDQKQTFFSTKDGLSEGAPFLVKQNEDGQIWLSTLISSRFEIKAETIRVFKFESDVHSLYDSPVPKARIYKDKLGRSTGKKKIISSHAKSKNLIIVEKNLQKCSQCGAKVNNLDKHIEKAHLNQTLYKCVECGVEVRDLEKHHKKTHTIEAKINAEYEKIRREKRRLELKNRRSTAKQVSVLARRGICPLCDYRSKSEMAMIAHIRAIHNKNPAELIKG